MIKTVSELVDALGGTRQVARLLGVDDSTVSGWKTRGLPAWACAPMRDALASIGKQADPSLFLIQRPQRVA